MVKNLPSNTRDTGSIPGQGTKIPQIAGQLNLRSIATELLRSRAHVPQLEKPRVPRWEKDLCSQKKKKKIVSSFRKPSWPPHLMSTMRPVQISSLWASGGIRVKTLTIVYWVNHLSSSSGGQRLDLEPSTEPENEARWTSIE